MFAELNSVVQNIIFHKPREKQVLVLFPLQSISTLISTWSVNVIDIESSPVLIRSVKKYADLEEWRKR